MSERKIKNALENILEHIRVVEERFVDIKDARDFINTNEGGILLDAISIRLQAIGENVKKIDKRNPEILHKHPAIDWENIIQFRDFISHQYELLNHEIIFDMCRVHIPKLKDVIEAELKILGE